MDAVARGWGVPEAAVRFLAAGGDLAIVSRNAVARLATADAVQLALERGRIRGDEAILRRERLRRLQPAAVPEPGVIGCTEHRALADEVTRRGAP
jgi:hypothetical protein